MHSTVFNKLAPIDQRRLQLAALIRMEADYQLNHARKRATPAQVTFCQVQADKAEAAYQQLMQELA